jgi:phage terminase large subunit-like protein
VLAEHVTSTRGQWDSHQRLNVYRAKQGRKIDAWYAAVNALSLMPEAESVYETRGLLVV